LEKRLEISLTDQKFWSARESERERERERKKRERERAKREEGFAMRTSGNASALYGHFWP
jgi:hypothetical protein